jgi:hypothetical protein
MGVRFSTTDVHSLIYSYLESSERIIFLSVAKEIFLNSKCYRQLSLNGTIAREYLFNKLFRERVDEKILPYNLSLDLAQGKVKVNEIGFQKVTDAYVASLGGVHTLNLRSCYWITNEGIRHLGNVHTLLLSGCDLM